MPPLLHTVPNEDEARAIESLKGDVRSLALLRVTATGLDKHILDANAGIRDLFQASGFHDYARQKKGAPYRVSRDATLVGASGDIETRVSVYRPETKGGDPRMWISGLDQFARSGDLLGLAVEAGTLRVFNLSQMLTPPPASATKADAVITKEVAEGPHLEAPLARDILRVLRASSRPLRAREIAWQLTSEDAQVTAREINAELYGHLSPYVRQTQGYTWTLAAEGEQPERGVGRPEDSAAGSNAATVATLFPRIAHHKGERARAALAQQPAQLSRAERDFIGDLLITDGRTLNELCPSIVHAADCEIETLQLRAGTARALREAGIASTRDLAGTTLRTLHAKVIRDRAATREAIWSVVGLARGEERSGQSDSRALTSRAQGEGEAAAQSAAQGEANRLSVLLDVLGPWADLVGDQPMTIRDLATMDPSRWPSDGGVSSAAEDLRRMPLAVPSVDRATEQRSRITNGVGQLLEELLKTEAGAVFAERQLALAPPTQQEVASRLAVSPARIGQLERRARHELQVLMTAERFLPVAWACHEVRWRLGAMFPVDELHDDPLGRLLLDEAHDHPAERRQLVLHLLGVSQVDQWVGSSHAPFPGNEAARARVADAQGVIGPIGTAADKVAALGIKRRFALQWLKSDPGIREIHGCFVRFDGSTVERATAVLSASVGPVHVDELAAIVAGPGEANVDKRIRQAFRIDDRGVVVR